MSPRAGHVLLRGQSGVGKELAARAIHELCGRSQKPLVARNAATFPESLVDAELFGNRRDYPNKGMPERPGLIGQADGSTLFLDEIGELSQGARFWVENNPEIYRELARRHAATVRQHPSS